MPATERRRGVPPLVADLGLTALVAFPTGMDAWWNAAGTRQADGWTFALLAVSLGVLPFRRRAPVAVTVVAALALTGWYVMGHHGELLNLPTMVGLYTVAVQGTRRRSVIAGLVGAAWFGTLSELAGNPVGSPVLEMLWPAVPLLLGEAVRGQRELVAEHRRRIAQAEADRDAEARRRVQEERLRIAQEFHDVVAHTLAAVTVHLGVAVTAFDARPDAARRALDQARTSTREALAELRATVGLLRDPSGDRAAPAPRLDQLGTLVGRARAGGVDASLRTDVGSAPLPAVVELAAYRVVQEALTNVLRHAGPTAAAVTVARTGEVLAVEVVNDAPAGPAPAPGASGPAGPGSGLGLVGMAERVGALGGAVEHGPRPGGGWRVHATIPLPAADGALARAEAPVPAETPVAAPVPEGRAT